MLEQRHEPPCRHTFCFVMAMLMLLLSRVPNRVFA